MAPQWLRARVEGSQVADIDGKQPTNVPAQTLKLQGNYDVAALPGPEPAGRPDPREPAHGAARQLRRLDPRLDPGRRVALRYETRVAGTTTTWRAGVENLFDRRAWRESPYEYSHVYLYPMAPRTFRVSMQVDL